MGNVTWRDRAGIFWQEEAGIAEKEDDVAMAQSLLPPP
ncbi:uncharacterized protein G2W53_034109 [Senna tora]|uniref:Uncharacterized protein n=1 Tax=Senna tora TaxID=362788 RepID=A0A834T0T1_9FABA|nr:uncharacterized protein G2W53_034109 [Senna tora]